uniref:2-dehydropantoate 2-reductase n=1 Tax=Aureoumbra lagunensis TaxID=44058 RepID=A0A7S3NM38_9STRA
MMMMTMFVFSNIKRISRHSLRRYLSGMEKQKIGIIGSGAVGTFFGLRLAEAGHEVRFLASRQQKKIPSSLALESWQGNYILENPKIYETTKKLIDSGENLDWILFCLKSTVFDEYNSEEEETQFIKDLLEPCVDKKKTRIQILMNGLGVEEKLAKVFSPEKIFGGLVYGGLSKKENTIIHQGVPVEIRGGSFLDVKSEIEHAKQLWKSTPYIQYSPQECLLQAQYSKLAWNIPFNGLTIVAGGVDVSQVWGKTNPDDQHVQHSDASILLRQSALGLMQEIVQLANADLKAQSKSAEFFLNSDHLISILSAITDKMAQASYIPSTTQDFLSNRPMEINSIFAEPLARAQALHIPVPRLELLVGLLCSIRNSQK